MIESSPVGSELVARLAWPPLSVTMASAPLPSLKVTVPVGVEPPAGLSLTVALNVTDCPVSTGLGEAVSLVVVVVIEPGAVKAARPSGVPKPVGPS